MTSAFRPRVAGLAFCGLAALIAIPAFASDDPFLVTPLAPGLVMLGADRGSYSDNSLVFTGQDGVLLVDTHSSAVTEELAAYVNGLGFGPPHWIVNTHTHVEHIGGNAAWGADPIGVAHDIFAGKLRRGTHLFQEYPPETFPEITFADSMTIRFNGETIRLVAIGGSHDINEILVHFTSRKIAHVSSVVNGFNFPSVDSDGDTMMFEAMTRRLMELLPPDTRLISGHNGQVGGFDFVGAWDGLEPYAEMMHDTIDIVRRGLADGSSVEEMQEGGVLDGYAEYAESYVDADGWIATIAEAVESEASPREVKRDICAPVFEAWKADGAQAAVARFRELAESEPDTWDASEYTLVSIGAKLHTRDLNEDACAFLEGSLATYPDAETGYYTHYVLAKSLQALGRTAEALTQAEESVRGNADFTRATDLLGELSNEAAGD